MLIIKEELTGLVKNFEQICLSESMKPAEIVYGTNLKNKQWFNDNKEYWTFFNYKDLYYCVIIDNDDVGFATSEIFHNDLNTMEKVVTYFNFNERKTSNAAKIFPFALFVIFEGVKKFNLDYFKFNGQNASLGELYKVMVYKNKYFNKAINDLGYNFEKEKNGYFYYKKDTK